jgi:hypothetical protein
MDAGMVAKQNVSKIKSFHQAVQVKSTNCLTNTIDEHDK